MVHSSSINPKRLILEQLLFDWQQLPFPRVLEACTSGQFCANPCTMSHYSAIEIAKQEGLPYALVFEDDAYPCNEARDMLENVLQDLPS